MLASTIAGSLIQSQRALQWIESIHAPVALGDRMSMYGHDLLNFAPLWGAIIAFSFLIAFLVAGWLSRRWPRRRGQMFPLAGLAAVVVALMAMEAMLPVTVVAAARDGLGLVLLGLSGALGGLVYALVVPQRQNGQN